MPSHWYAAHTYGGKEFVANANISMQGFTVLVPVHLQPVKRQQPRWRPLFQNYVFVLFDVERDLWQPIMHTYGVRKLLSWAPGRPQALPELFMTSLQQQLDPKEPERAAILVDCLVRVVRGPLINCEGLCSWTNGARTKLLMQAMGGEREIEFCTADLEVVPLS